ncbi:MAG TPA: ABC transporter permease [Bauldia sp.]|nr:ABC transporter permease [Bauldia sp.]
MADATIANTTNEPRKASGSAVKEVLGYLRRNPALAWGIGLILLLVLFFVFATLQVSSFTEYRPLSVRPRLPPSLQYPLGTDTQGRNLLALNALGLLGTLSIGLGAGFIGVVVATLLAFIGAYFGGRIDAVIRLVVDIGLSIPTILLLVIIAIAFHGLTLWQMALVVSMTAWIRPTRIIRSQVLSLRERAYVEVARMSGMGGLEIILKELLPNLMPLIFANFVASITHAILASIGLEALGLGPADNPSLGTIIYRVILYQGIIQGLWWWWLAPIVLIILIFIALFLISVGLDELADPRLRTTS